MTATKEFGRGFQSGTKEFGGYITTLINVMLLSMAYFLSVGIMAIAGRVKKKRFLMLKPTTEESYWVELNLKKNKTEEYYHQF